MSATHRHADDETPVVIDRHFVVAQATDAAARFFRPLVVSFEKVGPSRFVVRLGKDDNH